jgi:type II secretory pathway pseudopilin PulG
MESDAGNSAKAPMESRKLELEVQKLTLDVASARRIQRFELVLRLMPSLTILVTVLGFAFSVWQYSSDQAKGREAAERQAVREAEASQREFMKPLLDKQQELYFEAATAAAMIASSPDPGERRQAERKFWTLYWGPLVMVESTDVSGAMKAFGRCISGEDKCSGPEVQDRSLALASALEASILKTWNAKPEDFIKGQFVYR